MQFHISLAGINIEINAIYWGVYKMCQKYLTEKGPADIVVTTTPEDLVYERQKSCETTDGNDADAWPNGYLETLSVYRKIATAALSYNTFLMHGSVVAKDEQAFMFTAPSGTGKTTRTKFWLDQFPDSFIVNGDKPLLKVTDDAVYACGTPWCGKENHNTNTMVPLKAIFLLERADQTTVTELTFSEAFPKLLQQTYRPDGTDMLKTLQVLGKLSGKVRFFRFCSTLDPRTVQEAYQAYLNVEVSFHTN